MLPLKKCADATSLLVFYCYERKDSCTLAEFLNCFGGSMATDFLVAQLYIQLPLIISIYKKDASEFLFYSRIWQFGFSWFCFQGEINALEFSRGGAQCRGPLPEIRSEHNRTLFCGGAPSSCRMISKCQFPSFCWEGDREEGE